MKIFKKLIGLFPAAVLAVGLVFLFPLLACADAPETINIYRENETFTEVQSAVDAVADGGTIILWDHFGVWDEEVLSIPAGKKVKIELNGYSLGLTRYIVVNHGAQLTIHDNAKYGFGQIYYMSEALYEALVRVDGGTFILESGTIKGGKAAGVLLESTDAGSDGETLFTMNGGAISEFTDGVLIYSGSFVMNGGSISKNANGVQMNAGSFVMNGGSIEQNTNDGINLGKGKCVLNDGSIRNNTSYGVECYAELEMSGGEICNNAGAYGGGVRVDDGRFTIKGGKIRNNTARFSGGGVYIADGMFLMSGGEITENRAAYFGGGFMQDFSGSASVVLSGDAIIHGNTVNNVTNNVYLWDGKVLTISGSLSENASIGVSLEQPNSGNAFTSGLGKQGLAANFFSDEPQYMVTLNSEGEAVLEHGLFSITWMDGDTVLKTEIIEYGEMPSYTPAKADDDRYSYEFSGWTPSVTPVTGDATYMARYTKKPNPEHFLTNAEETEYTIFDAVGWDIFCDCLQDNDTYNRFSDKTVKLDADIGTQENPITRMAGSDSHDFCGAFDGQGHTIYIDLDSDDITAEPYHYVALFRYVSTVTPEGGEEVPAEILNLNVEGEVTTSQKFAGGLVGACWGTVNIENCRVGAAIKSSVNLDGDKDGTHGGIVGIQNGGRLTITGCSFEGSLLSDNGTIKCGGFIGWHRSTAAIYNSIFNPFEVTIGTKESATFARNFVDTYNCYYTYLLNDGETYAPYDPQDANRPGLYNNGKNACSIVTQRPDIMTLAFCGEPKEYSVSGITAFANNSGLWYLESFLAGEGDVVELALGYTGTPSEGYVFKEFATSAGELVKDGDTYKLTMSKDHAFITPEFAFADGVGTRVVGHTLSLDGDIGVNFYMELAPEVASSETAYMLFTVPSGEKTETQKVLVKEALPKGDCCAFKCKVSAKEMTSVIHAQLYDGGEALGTEYTYSVKEYADYLLANADAEHPEYLEAKPLVEKMLQYGAYAKEYFDKTNVLPDLGEVSVDDKYATIESTLPEGLFEGATLSLKSETTLSLYFKDAKDLTFTCVDEKGGSRTVESVRNGSTQIARIRKIAAGELKGSFAVTVTRGEEMLGTVTYSPMNYCYKALHGGTLNPQLVNTVKAFCQYAQAAEAYF